MSSWLEEAHKKLAGLPRWVTLSQIALDTGLQVSWLSAFASGKISDPGIRKVQKLNDYLDLLPTKLKPTRIKFGEQYRAHPDNDSAGVYIIWANDLCVYVGTSQGMLTRLCDHTNNDKILAYKPTHIDLIHVDDNGYRKELERIKIKSLNPVVNIKGR